MWAVLLGLSLFSTAVLGDAESGFVFTEPVSGNTLNNDFQESWKVGDTIDIAWLGNTLISSPADLWITHFDSDDYSRKLLQNHNITTDGTYSWTIDLTSDQVTDNKFVLRWSPHASTNTWNEDLGEQSSRGFFINATSASSTTASASTTATGAVTSPPSFTTTLTTAGATGSSTATSSATPAPSSSGGLSTGAKAGIAIGAVIAGLALIGLGLVFGRRSYKSRHPPVDPAAETKAPPTDQYQNPYAPAYSHYGYQNNANSPAWGSNPSAPAYAHAKVIPESSSGHPSMAPDTEVHEAESREVGRIGELPGELPGDKPAELR